MQLETSRFGTIEVDPNEIFTFTQPILGFQEYRRFVLIPGPEGGELKWLQSTESRDLAFIMMNPCSVVPEYEVEVSPAELAELAANTLEDLELYTLVTVPADKSQIRTNLKAPILLNPKRRLGKQKILERSDYPIKFLLAQAKEGLTGSQEVSHARSDP